MYNLKEEEARLARMKEKSNQDKWSNTYTSNIDIVEEQALLVVKLREKERAKKRICPNCGEEWSILMDTCLDCSTSLENAEINTEDFDKISDEDILEQVEKAKSSRPKSNSPNLFIYVVSFIIPLVGFIIGAMNLSKESQYDKQTGKTCIIIGLASTLVCFFFVACSLGQS